MQDEPEPEAAHEEQRSSSVYEQARRYRAAKTVLQDVYALDEKHAEAVRALEQLWAEGYTVAQMLIMVEDTEWPMPGRCSKCACCFPSGAMR